MIKKIFFILFLAIMLTAAVCFAESPKINIDPAFYDKSRDCFTIKGTLENEIENTPLTLEVTLNQERIFVQDTVAYCENDVPTFQFRSMYLPPTAKSGTYIFTVKSSFSDAENSVEYEYQGIDLILPILKKIDKAISQNISLDFFDTLENNDDLLLVGYSDINNLGKKEKEFFFDSFLDKSYQLPEELTSVEDIQTAKAALLMFRDDCKNYLSMAEFFNIKNSADSKAWFEKYSDLYGYTNENKISTYLDVTDKEKFLKRIVLSSVSTVSDMAKKIDEIILLTNIELKSGSTVNSILKDFPENLSGISSKYESLSASNKAAVMNAISGKHYESYSDVVAAINAKIKGDSDNSSQGGSASEWGVSSDKYNVSSASIKEQTTDKSSSPAFSDLPKTHWAYQAIIKLYEKKIINGYSDNIFAPDKSITRAEFIKILMNLYSSDKIQTVQNFDDVTPEHWAYTYIKKARESGIINGDENNCFMPDKTITREDMLVMLLRTVKDKKDINTAKVSFFDDFNQISDYAVEAVSYFYDKKIINGVGNNMFMPKNAATRAEVCKLLNEVFSAE